MDSYDKVTDKRVREISNVDLTSIFKCAFISKPQNSTLGNCATNGVDVHLFEVMDEGRYTYCGRIELVGNLYTETQLGEDGAPRLVWMFPIRSVPENDVKKPGMFVFKDMEDYRKNGKKAEDEYNAGRRVKARGKKAAAERIRHKKFGLGTVVERKGDFIVVNFDKGGRRQLNEKVCREKGLIEVQNRIESPVKQFSC